MPEQIQEAPKEKIKFEYQHTDEQGNPIIDPRTGKPAFTFFTGENWQEIAEKQKDAYLNVSRALARSRNQKPVPKAPEPVRQSLSPEQERQAVADLQDPTKAKEAIRKLGGIDEIERKNKIAEEKQFAADAQKAVFQFMSAHVDDYFRCKANSDLIAGYINENDLDPRVADNYEVAFNAVESRLAERPKPAPPAVIPSDPPLPEPPKRQAAGLRPGELSGRPPIPKAKGLKKEDIKKMRETAEGRAEYKKRMRDPAFVAEVDALFASR